MNTDILNNIKTEIQFIKREMDWCDKKSLAYEISNNQSEMINNQNDMIFILDEILYELRKQINRKNFLDRLNEI